MNKIAEVFFASVVFLCKNQLQLNLIICLKLLSYVY